MKLANNPPTDYARISVDIGRKAKRDLIKYATTKRKSVSSVIRDLVEGLLKHD
jgi:hypothetical protein